MLVVKRLIKVYETRKIESDIINILSKVLCVSNLSYYTFNICFIFNYACVYVWVYAWERKTLDSLKLERQAVVSLLPGV